MAFEKVLLSKNQGAIDNETFQLQNPKNYFQTFVDRLQIVGITAIGNDLETLINNPKAYITDKLTAGEEMKVGGLTLNKEKLFELLEKPVGTTEIISDLEKDHLEKSTRESMHWLANRFAVLEGIVTIRTEVLEHINNNHSLFITSETQASALILLNELVVIINNLNDIDSNSESKISGSSEFSRLISFNQTTKKHDLRVNAVKGYR